MRAEHTSNEESCPGSRLTTFSGVFREGGASTSAPPGTIKTTWSKGCGNLTKLDNVRWSSPAQSETSNVISPILTPSHEEYILAP